MKFKVLKRQVNLQFLRKKLLVKMVLMHIEKIIAVNKAIPSLAHRKEILWEEISKIQNMKRTTKERY